MCSAVLTIVARSLNKLMAMDMNTYDEGSRIVLEMAPRVIYYTRCHLENYTRRSENKTKTARGVHNIGTCEISSLRVKLSGPN